MSLSRWMLVLVLIPLVAAFSPPAMGEESSILGAWKAEKYDLKDGSSHALDGLIFFTDSDWATLFFTSLKSRVKGVGAYGEPRIPSVLSLKSS